MKARPILMSAPMVCATLRETQWPSEGKTQTRRIMKHPEYFGCPTGDCPHDHRDDCAASMREHCPYGQPGDLLWVRETWNNTIGTPDDFSYRATVEQDHPDMTPEEIADLRWTPSIHMPRRASRLTLRITDVRVQRLQEISEADALAEGITGPHHVGYPAYRMPGDSKPRYSRAAAAFEALWGSINGAGSWDADPMVWAITFQPILKNVDAVLAEVAQ